MDHSPVVVVGVGPIGLAAAAELMLRCGWSAPTRRGTPRDRTGCGSTSWRSPRLWATGFARGTGWWASPGATETCSPALAGSTSPSSSTSTPPPAGSGSWPAPWSTRRAPWAPPNPLGGEGYPAPGGHDHRDRIRHTLPDPARDEGRSPSFLARTGYEQVRSIAAALAGDHEAARALELILPGTGVCGGAGLFDADEPSADQGCCGSVTTGAGPDERGQARRRRGHHPYPTSAGRRPPMTKESVT